MLDKKTIVFTHHALKRARQRHLWKYVSKEKFFYDAGHLGFGQAKLGDCIYIYMKKKDKTFIITMY